MTDTVAIELKLKLVLRKMSTDKQWFFVMQQRMSQKAAVYLRDGSSFHADSESLPDRHDASSSGTG